MIERKLIPAVESSPTRCQAQGDVGEGQCKFESMEGTNPPRCPKHGGVQDIQRQEKKKLHDYRLQIWQEELDRFAESDNVKNLRGEIGVLRITLQALMNMCKDPHDLLLYSSRISNLTASIERITSTCDKLESKTGMLLDKSAALVLASRVVKVISEHVDNPVTCDAISKGIIDILSDLGASDE